MSVREQQIAQLQKEWSENPRWQGLKRGYDAVDVVKLRGSVKIEHTLARLGAEKLWKMCSEMPFVSYGGTALLTLFIGIGILMSIHGHRRLVQT